MSPYTMNKIEEPMRCAVKFLERIGNRDVAAAGELLDEACVFKDMDSKNLPVTSRSSIVQYFQNMFCLYPVSKIVVSGVSNFPHKCLAEFRWFGIVPASDEPVQCVGIFEVRNALICAVDFYCKK